MKHALIIEDNMLVGRFIEDRLTALGFGSFDHAWTEEQAVAAALKRFPDLVIIGDDVTTGCGFSAALRICRIEDVPVLVVSANGAVRRGKWPDDVSMYGPCALQDIDRVVGSLSGPTAHVTHA